MQTLPPRWGSVSGVNCETLSAEHHVILLAEHRFSSMTASSRWIADTWMIISSGEIDWERLATDAERLGLASITATANTIAGSYNVTAAVSGVAGGASFALTNGPGQPASIVAVAGTPQAAAVGTPFA